MFPTRYFDDPYFAPRYFPKAGANPTPPPPSANTTGENGMIVIVAVLLNR